MKYYTKEQIITFITNKELPDNIYLPKEGLHSSVSDICAIANTKGGILLFGVNNNLKLVGVKDINNHIKDIKSDLKLIHPKPKLEFITYIINNI